MAVHLTRIYTRTGDDGSTGLSDFSRIAKTDPRLIAYADCDETNSALGLVVAFCALPDDLLGVIRRIQNELFDLGADLSNPGRPDTDTATTLRIDQTYVDRLEADCDRFNADLAPLNSFVLPGGTPAAALLHQARTIARRAERSAWALKFGAQDTTNPLATTYLNRLSDLLFILARVANPEGDVTWVPGGER